MDGSSVSLPAMDPDKSIGEEPCIVYYYDEWDSKILRFFAWSPENWYTFYVPEGSIIENYYEVDLEG